MVLDLYRHLVLPIQFFIRRTVFGILVLRGFPSLTPPILKYKSSNEIENAVKKIYIFMMGKKYGSLKVARNDFCS